MTSPSEGAAPARGGSVAFLDATAGVSGDMWLGALVGAGLPVSALEEVVEALGLHGVTVRARAVTRGAFAATKVDVVLPGAPEPAPEARPAHAHAHEPGPAHAHGPSHGHDHPHDHPHEHPHEHAHDHEPGPSHPHGPSRGHEAAHAHHALPEVLRMVRGAKGLPAEALADAEATFTELANAEGLVHGIPPERVHFHEVGAADALVDVLGTCVGLRRLGVREVRVSSLPWGGGTVRAAHGDLPLPAPAVVHLLAGHPTHPSGETFEQVTPTGAALVRALSRGTATPAGFVPRAIGVGAGARPGGRLANVVRLVLGDVVDDGTPGDATLLETNLDDATGQQAADAIERALAGGALDAWATPAVMKKGRPGLVLSVLCRPEDAAAMEAVLFRETPTLGVRRRAVARTVLARRIATVRTEFGPVRVKVRATPDGERATPEHDDCRAAAERAGVAVAQVARAALRAFEGA